MEREISANQSVFDYTDYRLFLADSYEAKRKSDPSCTHRTIVETLGFRSSGFFSQIIHGQTNISAGTAEKLAGFFNMSGQSKEYFVVLVAFNQAALHNEKQKLFKHLLSFCRGEVRRTREDQYEFYEQWYYSAIREAVAFIKMRNTHDCHAVMARLIVPPIKPGQVKKALTALERLGLIRMGPDGYYERTDRVISTGNDAQSVAITSFASATLDLAKNALENMPRNRRSVSAVTLSLNDRGLREIEERLALFRREIMEIAYRQHDVDSVYQFNFQVFPLTSKPDHRMRGAQ